MKNTLISLFLFLAINSKASELVVLMPSHAEIVCELGACSEISGVGAYCDWPKELEKKQKVGDYFRPDLEKIYALKPDLILLPYSENSSAAADLRKLKLRVEELKPEKKIADICLTAQKIGSLINRKKEAEKFCASLKKDFSSLKPVKSKRVFFEIDSGFWTFGGDSFLNEMLEKAGLENVFSQRKEAYFKVSWETILKENPEIIISNSSKPGDFYSLPLSKKIQAVSNKKVFTLDKELRDLLVRPGPRSPFAAKKLSELVNE